MTHLSVPLKAVAVGSILLTLTSLVLLVIIVSIKDVDLLSTVALGLAILAFVVQLIVYIVQTAAANQQLLQSQQLHGATLRILAEIEEKSAGTQATVRTISERLLAHVLGKAIPEASAQGLTVESHEFSTRVADLVARRLTETPGLSLAATTQQEGPRPQAPYQRAPEDEDISIVEYMMRYPEASELDEIQRTLESLYLLANGVCLIPLPLTR